MSTAVSPNFWLRLSTILLALAGFAQAETLLPEKIEFNRHIRPMLSDKCFFCHGPDKAKQKAGFRIDLRDEAIKDRDGIRAIVPGNPDESDAFIRCISSDPEEQMPPPDSKLKLEKREIALLKKWIEQGAEYQAHWAFIKPQSAPLPEVADAPAGWSEQPIDGFILANLRKEGLSPSPAADKTTLLRRVTLDLTGLPPAPAEVDAFLADKSPQAFSKVVDRLLASPAYGERMALPWLDAARYADTNGYQSDMERTMWPWRDWVINAFNKNMPFDQFTIEQVAGDLLPNATTDQIIASGFNRNHRINGESGVIAEEYLVEYIVDRVDTTATVWMGLTAGCARCHDHKYDPITQKDFFQIYAYFHNIPEVGRDGRRGQPPPVFPVPTAEQKAELDQIGSALAAVEKELAGREATAPERLKEWLTSAPDPQASISAALERQLAGRYFAEQAKSTANLAAKDGVPKADVKRASGWLPGPRTGEGLNFDGKTWVNLGSKLPRPDRDIPTSFSLWVKRGATARMPLLSREDGLTSNRGFHLVLDEEGRVEFQLAHNDENNAIKVATDEGLPLNEWRHVTVTYDGSALAAGVRVFVNGSPAPYKVILDSLTDSLRQSSANLSVGGGELRSMFTGGMHDLRFYTRALTEVEIGTLAGAAPLERLIGGGGQVDGESKGALLKYFQEHHDPEWMGLTAKLRKLRDQLDAIDAKVVKTLVMREMATPRETFVLKRGEYDKPGERVNAAIPDWLPPLPAGAPNNRLGFAQWLVSPENPLTARVTVNRLWQMLFGVGLVKTSEDFGSQGELPAQQDLLDWLAVTYSTPRAAGGLGWDTKALLKLIVSSAAYQQDSRVSPQLRERDPENRLLARGPRFRLHGQAIRDQALAVSGLLVAKVGGPSVKPYQPAGLWEEVSFQRKDLDTDFYVQDKGDKLYRKSLYTFWKRTVNPPTMQLFDASGREVCSVRARVTNTPLQALALLNENTFVEAARGLGQRMLTEVQGEPTTRLKFGLKAALARDASERELEVLLKSLDRYRARYSQDAAAVEALLKVGESPVREGVDRTELAAYTAIANTILNLDELITKE